MPAANSEARKRRESSLQGGDLCCGFPPRQVPDVMGRDIAPAQTVTVEWLTPDVIGLSGWAQSGKDSTGRVLVARGYKRLAFADALKDVLYDLNPVTLLGHSSPYGEDRRYTAIVADLQDLVDTHGWEWVKANTNAREYLQRLGVAVREHVSPDAWVTAVTRQFVPGEKYVITDVRFPNEHEAIKRLGGQVWRVTRDGHVPPNDHVSEHALDAHDFDWHLTLPDFKDDLDALHTAIDGQVGAILDIAPRSGDGEAA